jgi:hypothetical protein
MESGQENLTLDTIQRMVCAMDGRFYVSIHPQECDFKAPKNWWGAADFIERPWTYHGMMLGSDGGRELAMIGISRPFASANSNTNADALSIQPAGTSAETGS